RVVNQPVSGPLTKPKTTSVAPAVATSASGRPNPRAPAAVVSAGSSHGVAASASATSGTLTKKTHSQPSRLVSTPPPSAPTAAPEAPAAPHTAIARLRL